MFITAKTRFQSRLNSIIMLCLLSAVSGLSAWLSNKHVIEYDWTATGRHSLSEASRELLAKMPGTIEMTSYARENQLLRTAIKKFIARYQRHKQDIVLEFVNPDAKPDEVRELGISINGEIIVRYRGRSEHVKSDSEQDFTNALQRLARNRERWLAFIEGHGERSALGERNFDLGEWGKQLSSRGYQTQPVDLGKTRAIPDNADILVIAGPRVDYLPGEVELIIDFIRNGGNLLWLHDPGPLHGLEALGAELSINFHAGAVVDDYVGRLIGIDDPTITLVSKSSYAPHPVTDGFELNTLFPLAGAIEVSGAGDWTATPLITSGDHTWLETAELEGTVEFDDAADIPGPLTVGLGLERAVERRQGDEWITGQQRIVVMGDGDFLSNTWLANGGNTELGTRIINWLSRDDEFIAIPPRVATDTQLNLSRTTLGIMGIGFLFILPTLLLAVGITIGLKRKRQ